MSVRLKYQGRLGNNLLQYALGRYIAELKKYKLYTIPIQGFVNTYDDVVGIDNSHNPTCIVDIGIFRPNMINSILNFDGTILMNGEMPFKYDHHLKPYKHLMSEWLKVENEEQYNKPNENDLVLHIRLGDYLTININGSIITDINLYKQVIKTENFDKCYVVTDSPDHPYITELINIGCILVNQDTLSDFVFLKNAKKIIISKSTFSWIAAYIGNANKIYFPLSDNKYPYYLNPTEDQPDYRVYDEDRWIII